MRGKKGFLLGEETVKIIIAVIALGFLVYLLVAIYFNSQKDEEQEQAKASLDYLITEIASESEEIEIYSPSGWSILSWPFDGKSPEVCSSLGWSSCICICETPSFTSFELRTSGNYLDNCNENGVCKENSKDLIVGGSSPLPIGIDNPPITLGVNYGSRVIFVK